MKRIFYIAALVTIIQVFYACGSDDKKQQTATTAAVQVMVQKAVAYGGKSYLTASGKIQASNSANLSTRMMGFVNKIHIKVGDEVQKRQLLVSINNTDLQAKAAQASASITRATASYENAKKDYNRFKNLFAENSASQKEMDDMTARFEMTKAQLEAAKQMKNEVNAQFSYTNIRSPFKGVITNKFIEEGDMANPGMPLVAVETPGRFEVTAMIPESEISRIMPNVDVQVMIKSLNRTIRGKVTEISTSARNTGGQYLVKVDLDKTDAKILSGMYATVQFPIEKVSKNNNKVLILSKALVAKGQLSGVYTVSQNNTAVLRWLRLGETFGESVEVLSGLSAEELYIISSESKLYNGVKITVQ
ncbi:efflux RND transporter periplasmic adaptor subunit [Ascidiimonas sp. W6]|uniref:efflux RND transporter periplasmic adaptor subunit n=1 Tax=Ascidiimonas meishanensis TaxID=3128903 RepID=UPI0030EC6AA5